jgi:hypothetical protein
MKEYSDRRVWSFDGHEVTCLLIDYRFEIEIWWADRGRDNCATFTIEAPFILRGESEQTCDPERTDSLAPALRLLHQPVESVTAYRNGLLLLRFTDGTEVRVPKRRDGYETWQAFGSGELHDISMLCSAHDVAPWGGSI